MIDDNYSYRDLVILLKEPEHRIQAVLKRHSSGDSWGHPIRYTDYQLRLLRQYFIAMRTWRDEKAYFDEHFKKDPLYLKEKTS